MAYSCEKYDRSSKYTLFKLFLARNFKGSIDGLRDWKSKLRDDNDLERKIDKGGMEVEVSLRNDNDFDLECRKIGKRMLLRNDNDNYWESRRMYGICGKYIRKYLQNASGMRTNKISNFFS